MFSTILHSSAAFLFPYYVPSESASKSQVDQQIQTELQQAAEQGMVFTRSQDSTPAGGASQSSELLCPQVLVYDEKRKASNGGHESPAQAVTKRRRRSTKLNREAAPSSSASNPGRPPRSVSTKTAYAIDPNVSDQEPSALGSRVNPSQTPGTTTEEAINNDEDKAIEVAINKPSRTRSSDDEASVAHDRVKPHSDSATRSRKGKIQKKRTKDSDGIAAVDRNGADMRISGKKPKTLSATAATATHKRFGSEGIEEPGTVRTNGIEEREGSQEDISEDEGDSGDEAPETVTASAGFDKARASALDAAKVAARYMIPNLRTCSIKGN